MQEKVKKSLVLGLVLGQSQPKNESLPPKGFKIATNLNPLYILFNLLKILQMHKAIYLTML